ncbi:MAG: TatD-related deoxyribonuclease [Thermoplasmata archaeon]|jgi:TatD-related deoxyribonuclease|nr:TatD-related deoxyribonuclease [Thermoplasmata archaeon]
MRYPVWDDHFHLDPAGPWEQSVKDFLNAGGTHVMLVHKPYHEGAGINRSVADHERQFGITLDMADKARALGLKVHVAISPHPAEFTSLLTAGVPMDEAEAIHRGAQEAAAKLVRAGKAVAMAEVGRPHWRPVPDEIMARANALMEHAFALAADAGCPVQIHAETTTPESFADLAAHLAAAGLPAERAVKHYSAPILDPALNRGLWPSVLIGKGSAEDAIRQGTRFLMETDFMCDPRYPGAVLGPKTVPRRTADLIAKGLMTEEQAWIVHAENPKRVYGVEVMP